MKGSEGVRNYINYIEYSKNTYTTVSPVVQACAEFAHAQPRGKNCTILYGTKQKYTHCTLYVESTHTHIMLDV